MQRIVVWCMAASVGAVAALPAQETGSVTGIVTAAETGAPLEGVRVSVEGTVLVTLTSARGVYRLNDVPAGDRMLVAAGLRRGVTRLPVAVAGGRMVTIGLTLPEQPAALDELVVTASREEESKSRIPAAITAIGRDAIDQTRPHHPAELMSQVPGAMVVDLGGEGNTMALRQPISFKPVYGYLEDGVPIRSTGFFNHNALYEVNIPGADRVEVMKGPGSALYGSDAIGGVVNALTRAPSAAPSAELFVEGGRFGYKRMLLAGSTTRGSDGLRADFNLTDYDGYRDGTAQRRESGTARWDHLINGSSRLKTVVTFSRIDSPGDGGSDVDSATYRHGPRTNFTPIAYRQVRALRWSTAFEHLGERSRVSVTPYARYNRLELLPSWQLTYDPEVWDIKNYSLGLLLQGRHDLAPLEASVIGGVDLDWSPGSHVSDSITATKNGAVFASYVRSARIYDYDVTFRGISPYLQAELSPFPRVRVTAGLRYDHMGFEYDNKLDVVQIENHRRPASTTVWYDHLSPKLGATVAISPAVSAFVSYRHAFRAPSESQLFRQGSAVETVSLEPVRANSYEVGIRGHAAGRLTFEVSAYTMTVKDDILTFLNTMDNTSQTSNAGRSRHRGIEVGAGLGLTTLVRLETAYTYRHHQYQEWVTAAGDDFSGNEIESAPRHIANTRVVLSPFRGHGSAVAEWQHVGGYFTDQANEHRYGGHNLFNLYLTAPVALGFDLVGRVNNLANTRYAVGTSFNPFIPDHLRERFTPGLPRTFFLGAQYRWSRG